MKLFFVLICGLLLNSTLSISYAGEQIGHGEETLLGPCSCVQYTKKNYRNVRYERKFFSKYVHRDYTCTYICQTPQGQPQFVDGEYTDREKVPYGTGKEFICDGLIYEWKTNYRQIKGVYHEISAFELINEPHYAFTPQSSRALEVQEWGQKNCSQFQYKPRKFSRTIKAKEIDELATKAKDNSLNQ